jgi:hypothetical protein
LLRNFKILLAKFCYFGFFVRSLRKQNFIVFIFSKKYFLFITNLIKNFTKYELKIACSKFREEIHVLEPEPQGAKTSYWSPNKVWAAVAALVAPALGQKQESDALIFISLKAVLRSRSRSRKEPQLLPEPEPEP